MNFKEKTLSQKYHFKGKIICTRVDEVELPNGKISSREVCEHIGGVGVLPIDSEGNVTLVKQFRYPYGELIYEIPAGKLDHGDEESIEECGKRELIEETGLVAQKMISLGKVYPSPGFLNEIVHIYVATDLKVTKCCPEENEFIECAKFTFKEFEQKIASGEINDAKTIIAAYRAKMIGMFG